MTILSLKIMLPFQHWQSLKSLMVVWGFQTYFVVDSVCKHYRYQPWKKDTIRPFVSAVWSSLVWCLFLPLRTDGDALVSSLVISTYLSPHQRDSFLQQIVINAEFTTIPNSEDSVLWSAQIWIGQLYRYLQHFSLCVPSTWHMEVTQRPRYTSGSPEAFQWCVWRALDHATSQCCGEIHGIL